MSRYEELLKLAEKNNILVCEKRFKSNAKGLCKGDKVAINKELEFAEKTCVLAEELGHCFTTVGNILNQNDLNNRKQERKARVWGYDNLIKIDDLVIALLEGCNNLYEVAEFLEITEECLLDAIKYFKEHYGVTCNVGDHKVFFSDCGYCVI